MRTCREPNHDQYQPPADQRIQAYRELRSDTCLDVIR